MSGFAQALPVILKHEGGYVTDPVDRGGATNFGVTQATYDAWRASVREKVRPVKEITTDEVEARPGRNDPCPCRSGRKFKRCCA